MVAGEAANRLLNSRSFSRHHFAVYLFHQLLHIGKADAHMGGIVATLAITNQQELRRLVLHAEFLSYFIGNGPVAQQVEVINDGIAQTGVGPLALNLAFGRGAD